MSRPRWASEETPTGAEGIPLGAASNGRLAARRRPIVVGLALAGAVAYGWVLSGLAEFSHAAAVVTAVPILAAGLVSFIVAPAGPRLNADGADRVDRAAGRMAWWVALVALFVAWELRQYLGEPRFDYPTISSMFDDLFRRSRPSKVAAILVWLGVGAYLTRSAVSARRRRLDEPAARADRRDHSERPGARSAAVRKRAADPPESARSR